MVQPKYKRILLKLSGEALSSPGSVFDWEKVSVIAKEIVDVANAGVRIAIVTGAGNIWRGRQGCDMDRVTADRMGMTATVINSLAVADALERAGAKVRVMTAFAVGAFTEPYDSRRAIGLLDEGYIVVIGGGTGSPYFTTDTGAVLRALEIKADAALFAKNVDGVYDADPRTDPNAKKFDELTYSEMLKRDLKAVDLTAASMAEEGNLDIICFALAGKGNILKASCGEKIGTKLHR